MDTGTAPAWYLTRGLGATAVLLLSAAVVLGLLTQTRARSRQWPRFVTARLHRDLSLLALIVVGLHVSLAVLDPFTHIGLLAAIVPGASPYRRLAVGLGTISSTLVLAVCLSSALRTRLPWRAWRAVHWLTYPAWVAAVAHGLAAGTDRAESWMLALTISCILAVGLAAARRLRLHLAASRRLSSWEVPA